MKGMQLIIPPLDDCGEQDVLIDPLEQPRHNGAENNNVIEQDEGLGDLDVAPDDIHVDANADAADLVLAEGGEGNNNRAMSQDLQDNFRLMRSLLRRSHRDQDQGEASERRRKVALETALAVESELARMRNGIAELEALLGEPGHEPPPVPRNVIIFPTLPPVVPIDSSDLDDGAVVGYQHLTDRNHGTATIGNSSDS